MSVLGKRKKCPICGNKMYEEFERDSSGKITITWFCFDCEFEDVENN